MQQTMLSLQSLVFKMARCREEGVSKFNVPLRDKTIVAGRRGKRELSVQFSVQAAIVR
jgi:hypothetical protein